MASAYTNNLAHVAALTTLLGSKTAESLVLGSRGAAGLAWAAMSSFGSFHVIKARVAGCIPEWLRETLAVDSAICHTILGKSARMDNKSMLKAASDSPKGMFARLGCRDKHARLSIDCVYAFDDYTSGIVRSCPPFQSDNAPVVYAYARDGPPGDTTRDWVAIVATVMKLVETVILWQYAGWQLSLASTVSWTYFVLAAAILRILGLSREFSNLAPASRRHDIFAGDFPTLHGIGQEMKIILGVPVNVRSHIAWRLTWALGSIACLSSTVASFLLLEAQTTRHFCVWAIFQSIWLVARYFFRHIATITDGRPYPVVKQKVLSQRFRLLSLAGGMSRYLAQLHARQSECYLQELHDAYDIKAHVCAAKCRLDWKRGICGEIILENKHSACPDGDDGADLDVLAVIGDTMLASISWIHGSKMSCLDLYDACLVIFKINQQIFLIPSARVLSGNAGKLNLPPEDAEAGQEPRFIPKLGPCRGENNGWVYWIPIEADRWLYLICDLNSLGVRRAEILHSVEVTRRLAIGNLWVSVENADELKTFVDRAAFLGGVLIDEFLTEENADTDHSA